MRHKYFSCLHKMKCHKIVVLKRPVVWLGMFRAVVYFCPGSRSIPKHPDLARFWLSLCCCKSQGLPFIGNRICLAFGVVYPLSLFDLLQRPPECQGGKRRAHACQGRRTSPLSSQFSWSEKYRNLFSLGCGSDIFISWNPMPPNPRFFFFFFFPGWSASSMR